MHDVHIYIIKSKWFQQQVREGLNWSFLRHTVFITRGRLQTKITMSSLCLSRLIYDWRLNKTGKREKKQTVVNYCNTICSYGSGGTKTLGSAPLLEPKGKINTGTDKVGAFMAFKKGSGRDQWFDGWSWEGAAPVRPRQGPGCPHPLTLGPDVNAGPRKPQ